MFLKSKQKKVKEDLYGDCKIVIYSTKKFIETFDSQIKLQTSKLDAETILNYDSDLNRIQALIDKFTEISSSAMVDTLIITGYKREGSKLWKIWNLFF